MITDDVRKQFNYLIIDDFEQMRVSFKGMLSNFGAENIATCGSGEAALKALAKDTFDVVICDYNLGEGKDGQQVLEEARHLGYLGHASIFFMITAESSLPMVLGALEYQPDEYMVKPINREVLHHRLESAIHRKRQLKAIDDALSQGDMAAAIACCVEKRGSDLKQSLYLAKLQAELCLDIHRYDDAQRIYSDLLSIRDFHWARFGLGKVAYYKGDYAGAETAFRALIEKNKHYLEVYDWLATVLESRDECAEAKELLCYAVKLSPKSVARQRKLGLLALHNSDQELAEKTLQSAVRWGRKSCFASAEEYRRLAEIYQQSGQTNKMVKLLADGRKRFSHRPTDSIQMLCGQALAKHSQNQGESVDAYLQEVEKLVHEHKREVTAHDLLLTAKDCFQLSQRDKAHGFLSMILGNKHDDQQWIDRVRQTIHSHGQPSEAEELIEETKSNLAGIHARCVELLKRGSQEQAINLLNETVDRFPYNRTMILLAAQAMIEYMRVKGADNRYHFRCRHSLAVLCAGEKQDPEAVKFLDVLNQLPV